MADEESRQWRSFNLLWSVLRIRGCAVAEGCHPLWNDFRRACKEAKLAGVLLKCTSVINYGHGPWTSGKRRVTLKQAAKSLMNVADDSYMTSLTERVLFDRGWEAGGRVLSKREFLSSYAVTRRLPYDSWHEPESQNLCPSLTAILQVVNFWACRM